MSFRVLLLVFLLSSASPALAVQGSDPQVEFDTSLGSFTVTLDTKAAPKTVENFLAYVESGFYENTIFHRVIKQFMVQGGGLNEQMKRKTTNTPVVNEANNGLENLSGTIAMARTGDPHSATAQFFINVKDNSFLNYKSETARGWGYCVFGRVTKGMEVIRKIEMSPTTFRGGRKDVPIQPIVIKSATLVTSSKKQ